MCKHDGAQKIDTKNNGGHWYRIVTCMQCNCIISKEKINFKM